MSTRAQHMGADNSWTQPQYSFKQPLQLEEQLPYFLESSSDAQSFPQQHHASQRPYNRPMPSSSFTSYASSNPYSTSSNHGFVQQGRTSSFNPVTTSINHNLDTPTPTLLAVPRSALVPATYNQSNGLEANQANYQFGAGLDSNHHAAGGSPNPNTIVTGPSTSTSHSFLPAGPMQFSQPQLPPRRTSELQAHYFSNPHSGMSQGSSSNAKRHKTDDEYQDNQLESPDSPQEPDVTRPKQSVD
jgi:hypothetical protein